MHRSQGVLCVGQIRFFLFLTQYILLTYHHKPPVRIGPPSIDYKLKILIVYFDDDQILKPRFGYIEYIKRR